MATLREEFQEFEGKFLDKIYDQLWSQVRDSFCSKGIGPDPPWDQAWCQFRDLLYDQLNYQLWKQLRENKP